MQSYTDIQSSQSLQSSLSLLLNNDKTALSCSSGTAFPTSNLQAGMLCYRTDQKKLYLLQDVTPTWKLLLDLNTNGGSAASEGIQSFLLRNSGGADEGGELVLQKPVTGSTLSGNIGIDLYKDQLRIFDSGTGNGFHIDMKTGAASVATKIWHDANDGAGSGLDADLLDGKQSGNASGNIPISNGTVNTNLNADMVDGKHVGNSTGQVPLSNTAVNTDLNADMLDGYHASSFVRTIQGVAPDVSGNVSVDLASRVAKSGDTMTGTLVAPQVNISSTGPVLAMADTDWGTRSLHHQNGLMGFLKSDGNWDMYCNNGGHLWTAAYGWLHDYFAAKSHGHSYAPMSAFVAARQASWWEIGGSQGYTGIYLTRADGSTLALPTGLWS